MISFTSPIGLLGRARSRRSGREDTRTAGLPGAWRRRIVLLVVAAMLGATLSVLLSTGTAAADTRPDPGVVATASAKSLPTWQINGVGWSQVVVGNTVYVTGNFTTARPPGVAVGGAGQVNVGHLLAYDIRTGNRIGSFNHVLNAQGRGIAASPDGSRIYVVGDFTSVDGIGRGHIAAFDTASGSLVPNFAPNVNGAVRAVTATNGAVYFGGSFSSVNGLSRSSLAAVNSSDAGLHSWAPGVDATVWSMVLTPDQSKVVIGGQFMQLNATDVHGHGAVSAGTGAILPWLANDLIHDSGPGAIGSLTTDGTYIYGTGWAFGAGASFEGTYAANPADGSIHWLYDCLGDTYSAAAIGDAVYTVGHAHDCTMIDEFPDTNPRVRWQHSLAFTKDAQGTNRGPDVYGWNYKGQPAPKLLHWYPTWSTGSFTGQYQAGWSVTGNNDYVAVAGEFPYVNGAAQQGLVRFGIGPNANNTGGPLYDTRPPRDVPSTTAGSVRPGTVRVGFGSVWDRDNETLSYQVVRDGNTNIGDPISRKTDFWTLPSMSITDTNVPPGNHTYRVRITDPFGNLLMSPVSNQVAVSNTIGAYGDTIIADNPIDYWRFGESDGNLALDGGSAGLDQSTKAGVTWGAPGAVSGNTAATFNGAKAGQSGTSTLIPGPDSFATEAWIKTTTTSGGKILGFGNSNQGSSNNYDRHMYMTNGGKLVFGVYTSGAQTITTSDAYNDGQWHHIVASMGSEGMRLYVDGILQGRQSSVTSGQPYEGYWLVGGDTLNGWPSKPRSNFFAGSIDEVAIYGAPLTLSKVRAHYAASGRTVNIPAPPSDTYGSAVYKSVPDFYWRLNETAGSVARDAMGAINGNISGGYTLGAAGAISGQPNDTSVSLDGSSGTITAASTVSNPTTYSEELWFNTTTTRGGKLVGMGNQPTGNSSSYDRHVWMLNNGKLRSGVWTGQQNVIESPEPYNDGAWHHMVATQDRDGMRLFVDGELVGTNPQNKAQDYTGYWRVGGDTHWGDADSQWFDGRIDEVAIYSRALPLVEVQAHFAANGGDVVNAPPVASFTASTVGRKVAVDGSGSSDPDGTIASYAWNFGDGSTATGATPSHTYAETGTYTVTLTVTDNRGDSDTTTRDVTIVNTPPVAAFTSSVTKLKMSVDAADSSDPDGRVESYAWDFGDGGTASTAAATHTYANAGTYDVRLTVVDNDGGTASVTHQVKAVVNQAPRAAFTSTTNRFSVSVDGSTSSDPDGTIEEYSWDFGDGSAATNATAEHTYAAAGTFTVKLTITDDDGAMDVATKSTTVTGNAAPVASFTASTNALMVTVDGSGSSDPDGIIATYAWDFGDGGTGDTATATHTYATAGAYTVKLTVTDNDGGSNSATKKVSVSENQLPTAAFTYTTDGLALTFDGSSSFDPDGAISAYLWSFGDGDAASTTKPSHTYAAPGTHSVTLKVTDDAGATDEVTKSIVVSGLFAKDDFARTVTNGLGTAQTGGPWALSGAASTFSVSNGWASMRLPSAGRGAAAGLTSVSSTDTGLRLRFTFDKATTGGGDFAYFTPRGSFSNAYRAKVHINANGAMVTSLTRIVGGTETTLVSQPLTAVTFVPAASYSVRVEAWGTSPTQLRAKVWRSSEVEPGAWTVSTTDSTAALQAAAGIVATCYVSGTSTNTPVVFRIADVVARETGNP